MPLGVLNNISAIYAENNLNQTQASLQNTLTQLSSGSRINSGADDPAGLAIADGLAANSAALTQSSSNASEGVGFLQVADGALSQVTSLLNSAVTLATEAGGGTLSSSQMSAANQEYQDILSQIGTIGNTTEYNGIQVFGSDTTMNALTWAEGSGAAASSATAVASQVAGGSITAGGTTAGAAVTSAGAYAAASNMTWTAGGSGLSSVITTGPIAAGSVLSGTLAFTPTHSSGSPNGISVNLGTTLTANTALSAQATQLQTAINTQAGNANEYTVSVVNGDQLQIGFGTHATTDHLTGFNTPVTGANTSGTVAAQTGYTLTGVNGDSLTSTTLQLIAQTTTPAGTAAGVVFAGSGTANVTATVAPGSALSGTIAISAAIAQGPAQDLDWVSDGSGGFQASITAGSVLAGGITVTPTGGTDQAQTISIAGVSTSNLESTLQDALGADYTVGYSNNTLDIQVASNAPVADLTGITSVAGASQATPSGTLGPTTVNLNGVTTANLESTIQTALGSNYTVTYDNTNDGTSGDLNISLNNQTAGSTVSFASNGVEEATAAQVSNGTPISISLAGTNTANLASVVQSALNGSSSTNNPNYTVAYNSTSGALSVTLTAAAATAGITGISWAGSATQTASDQASVAVTDGDTLGGTLTINQTIGGQSQTPVTVNLTGPTVDGVAGSGTSTANLVSTVDAALGSNAKYYTVGYNVNSGTGTLSIAVNAAGAAANVDSITILNGSNPLSQTQTTVSAIASGSTVLGDFTLTPQTAAGSGTAIDVDLDTTTTADLAKSLQSTLGSDYLVGYNSTTGNLSIGVSSAGAAAGITGFSVAEASSQAASTVSAPTGGVNIYTSDGTSTGSENYNVTVGTLSDANVGTSGASSALGTQVTVTVGGATGTGGTTAGGSAGTSLTGTDLTSQADAEAALQTVDNAINAVAYQRGQVGANINTLNAASNISSSQQTNITSAQNTITATDYASATSNLSKYEILTQTGISALAQANSTQQMVTKLLQ
jgi:flagellin